MNAMALPNDSAPTHIPPVVKPLAPYVKSRQEARQIRQALTSYLRSLIVFDEDQSTHLAQSHLALCVPPDTVTAVKRIPSDLHGLRKDYLKALAANVAARKDFAVAADNVASLRKQRNAHNRPADDGDQQEPGVELREYLTLLRDRRRHTKLQVFQHYLDELKTRDTTGLGEIENGQEQLPLPEVEAGRHGSETDLDELVHNLERALIRARAQLDREKLLFEKAKARNASQSQSEISPELKAQALQKTRDELVQWVEERLVGQRDPDESVLQDLPAEEIEQVQRELEERKQQIADQYAAYVQARRELLDAASMACQPPTGPPKSLSRSIYKNELATAEVPPPNPIDVLSYTSENLVPLAKKHKALALQKTYLSGLLAKEKSTTLRVLNRLSDESHLLPEYPIPVRQPRFKHAVSALSSRPQMQSSEPPTDEVLALAEAWAFASDAAATNEREFVQQKLALGTEVAQDARQTLTTVYGTLNQDLDEVMGQARERDGVLWASEPRSRGLPKASGSRIEQRPKGPWSGLHGAVGVE
ncbi:uncharacterized protein N7511_009283 [Penicillium nucicola]|uniref:uncharacterized protein n=1 Tax=Penicillium nucicola TaxID=1850975 RepID=UPI002544F186|nr:uncharacterized protein N7511_009283 [Penicillium nucicola]KAJ5747587.1 hypothetical protein N7511_009283 [Penicillium nucicola]